MKTGLWIFSFPWPRRWAGSQAERQGDTVETDKRGWLTSMSLSVLKMWRDSPWQCHLLSDVCALWLMRPLLAYDLITILACSVMGSELQGTWDFFLFCLAWRTLLNECDAQKSFLAPEALIHPKSEVAEDQELGRQTWPWWSWWPLTAGNEVSEDIDWTSLSRVLVQGFASSVWAGPFHLYHLGFARDGHTGSDRRRGSLTGSCVSNLDLEAGSSGFLSF